MSQHQLLVDRSLLNEDFGGYRLSKDLLASPSEVIPLPHPAVDAAAASAGTFNRVAQLAASRRNQLMQLHALSDLVTRFAFADESGGFTAVDVPHYTGAGAGAGAPTCVTSLTTPMPASSACATSATAAAADASMGASIVTFQNEAGRWVYVASLGGGDLALGCCAEGDGDTNGGRGGGGWWGWEAVDPPLQFPLSSGGEAMSGSEARSFVLEAAAPLPGGGVALLLWAVSGGRARGNHPGGGSRGGAGAGQAGGGSSAVALYRVVLTPREGGVNGGTHGGGGSQSPSASLRMWWTPEMMEQVAQGTAPPLWCAVSGAIAGGETEERVEADDGGGGDDGRGRGGAPTFVMAMEMSERAGGVGAGAAAAVAAVASPGREVRPQVSERVVASPGREVRPQVSERVPEWGPEDDEDAAAAEAPLGLRGQALLNPSYTAWRAFNEEDDSEGEGEGGGGEDGEAEGGGKGGNPFDATPEDGPLEVFSVSAAPPSNPADVRTPGASLAAARTKWASLSGPHRSMKPLAGVFVPASSPGGGGGRGGAEVLGCVGVSHGVHCLVVAVVASPSAAAAGQHEEADRETAAALGRGTSAVEVSVAHVGALQAFSYVAKGKPNRRFVLVTPDGTCGAVVETRRTSFVYRTPSLPSSPAAAVANPTSTPTPASAPASSGLHQILDLSSASSTAVDHADAPVLGARLVMSNHALPGGSGRGGARLIILLRGVVVTQDVREVMHG